MIQLNSIVTELGLARGLRGKKKLESAESSALILAAGGFNLFVAHSPRNDSWFSDQAPEAVNEGTARNGATGNYSEVLYGTEDWSQSELRAVLAQLRERAVEARMEEGDLVVSIRAESVCDRIVADVTGVSPSDD